MDDQSSDDGDFEHPDDVPTTEIPEINSADDAVDGDEDRKQRLLDKAEELREKGKEGMADALESEVTDDGGFEAGPTGGDSDEGTPVDLGDETTAQAAAADRAGKAMEAAHDSMDEDDDVDSLFTSDEADEVEDEFGDEFELEPLDDIPDDFDYEAQDTSDFGVGDREIDIRHNGVVFRLEQPTGTREDKFWGSIQQSPSLTDMFDAAIKATVVRPDDIATRLEEEGWSSFAKAGLGMKCLTFLGLDAFQDF